MNFLLRRQTQARLKCFLRAFASPLPRDSKFFNSFGSFFVCLVGVFSSRVCVHEVLCVILCASGKHCSRSHLFTVERKLFRLIKIFSRQSDEIITLRLSRWCHCFGIIRAFLFIIERQSKTATTKCDVEEEEEITKIFQKFFFGNFSLASVRFVHFISV